MKTLFHYIPNMEHFIFVKKRRLCSIEDEQVVLLQEHVLDTSAPCVVIYSAWIGWLLCYLGYAFRVLDAQNRYVYIDTQSFCHWMSQKHAHDTHRYTHQHHTSQTHDGPILHLFHQKMKDLKTQKPQNTQTLTCIYHAMQKDLENQGHGSI